MAYKKWSIANADKERASELSEKFNIDPFIAFLLVARGVKNDIDVSRFLTSSCELSDPFRLVDMDKAVARIEHAVDFGEKITVYGDYDCDGVTSTALLVSLLSDMGADVDYYIPQREGEGYGMNMSAIDKIAQRGTRLIITVDNGISALDEAEYIYALGMELVVTDHHQVGEKLPRAEAVINPHIEENELDFRDLAGVGVAFKLACALYGDTDDMLYRFADLVALGTIADVVPLLSENRALVKAGLEVMNTTPRAGINALKIVASAEDKMLSSTDVAFLLCPRINATGRVDDASRAVELLICEDEADAAFKAEQINIDNTHRQELERNILDDVKCQISENPALVHQRVIVIAGAGYHHGVIGIVAARVLDEYGKPVIILSIDEDGCARGSARSVDGFNIYDSLTYCSDILTKFGGHPKAAGMSLHADDIDKFRERINEYALKEHPVMPVQCVHIDCKLSPFYLNLDLAESLSVLEPFGEANQKAVFALMGLTLVSVTPIGNGKHIRLECEKKGRKFKIVKFGCSADEFPFRSGDVIDAAVRVSKNPYNGRDYLSVQAEDIRRHGIDDDKYFNEKSIYELFLLNMNDDVSVFPNREICSVVYKFLRRNNGWSYGFDELYFSINSVTYGQLKYALKAFEQSGLIEFDENKITVCQVAAKVDLMNTPIMNKLKGRLSVD